MSEVRWFYKGYWCSVDGCWKHYSKPVLQQRSQSAPVWMDVLVEYDNLRAKEKEER